MALPTFVANGSVFSSGVAGSVPTPAGMQADDILILVVQTSAEAPGTNPPLGWSEAPGSPITRGVAGAAGSVRISVFWIRCINSSEPQPALADAGDHQIARISSFRGCRSSTDPFDGFNSASSVAAGTALTCGGFTTTTADVLAVLCMAHATDTTSAQFGPTANADLANIAERFDNAAQPGNGGGVCLVTGEKAVAGAVGNWTSTLATSSEWGAVTFGLASLDAIPSGVAPVVILSEGY